MAKKLPETIKSRIRHLSYGSDHVRFSGSVHDHAFAVMLANAVSQNKTGGGKCQPPPA
jgi:hypothetical protein